MKQLFVLLALFGMATSYAQELKPTTTQAVLKVLVQDDKNKPLPNQAVTFISKTDKKEYSGITDASGRFSMLIPPAAKYSVRYKVFNNTQNDLEMDMPVSKNPYTFSYTLTITPPRTFTLDNVFFDSGKATLRAESNKELNELAEYMNLQKTLVIEIAGHTDNVGTAESNLKLSEERANAVKQYLVKKGIATERIQAKGYGDTQPVADNSTAAGKQKNRRTEVHVLSE